MFVHWQSYVPSPPTRALLFAGLWHDERVNQVTRTTCQHTLEKIGCPLAHSRVNERLGGLDVVVEVVAEGLDVGDDFGSSCSCQMAREED